MSMNRLTGACAAFALMCVGLLCGAGSAYAQNAQTPAAEPMYSARGEATCMKCHDSAIVEGDRTYKAAVDILQTPHAMKGDARTP